MTAMRCALLSTTLSWTHPPAVVRVCVFWGCGFRRRPEEGGGCIFSKSNLLLLVSSTLPTLALSGLKKIIGLFPSCLEQQQSDFTLSMARVVFHTTAGTVGVGYLAEKLEVCSPSPAALHVTLHCGCSFSSSYSVQYLELKKLPLPCF